MVIANMKTITISRKSWIYKFASCCNHDVEYYRTDICSFTRAVMLALFKITLLVIMAALAVAAVGDFAVWVAAGLMVGFVEPDLGASICCVTLTAFAILLIGAGTMNCYDKTIATSNTFSTIRAMVAAKKGKFCAKVTYED